MTREEIETFQQRIIPYLERQADKQGLESVCRMALAFADVIERNVDQPPDPEVSKRIQ